MPLCHHHQALRWVFAKQASLKRRPRVDRHSLHGRWPVPSCRSQTVLGLAPRRRRHVLCGHCARACACLYVAERHSIARPSCLHGFFETPGPVPEPARNERHRPELHAAIAQGNFLSKFARTIQEKAKADIERTKNLFTGAGPNINPSPTPNTKCLLDGTRALAGQLRCPLLRAQ